jgi:hypothetical protein
MIQPVSQVEIKKELDEILKDITKTVENNRAALSLMAKGLRTLFSSEYTYRGPHEVDIFYILRQAVYQKNGYSYIERKLKRKLWEQFVANNPDEITKTSEAIRAATGLRLPEQHISRAIELRVKERISHATIRRLIMEHTDNLLETIVQES